MRTGDFLRADWPAPPSIVAGTTLRTGGFSRGAFESLNLGDHVGDVASAVAQNRGALRDCLSLPAAPSWLRQVHGTRIIEAPFVEAAPEADACYTTRPDTVCVVMTADCLPALFCSRDGHVVAAAHAGWRGLLEGVLEKTVDSLPADPADIMVWLGPAISQPSFEVGDDVRARFASIDSASSRFFEPNDRGRWQADLYGLARQRLEGAGVTGIYGGGWCTHKESGRFFSYRRDGQCGRMASLVFRRQKASVA